MEIKDFVKEDKLQIPEGEIDNIYTWVRISDKQEVLMSSEVFFKWLNHSFEKDSMRSIAVLKQKFPLASSGVYQLSDFMTFNANRNKIFNGKRRCFVYCRDMRLIISLLCYLAHTMNLYLPEEVDLTKIIIDKIDDPDKIKRWLSSEVLVLSANAMLPEHKYKSSILNSLIIDRCRDDFCTLVHTFNAKDFLFDKNEALMQSALMRGAVDLDPMIKPWTERRSHDYHKLLTVWYNMTIKYDNLVYSKTEPKDRIRGVRHEC